MSSMSAPGPIAVVDPPPDASADAIVELFAVHCEARARLERAEYHLIVAAWNAGGRSMEQIGELNRSSRTPIRNALYRAESLGELRRPLSAKTRYADTSATAGE